MEIRSDVAELGYVVQARQQRDNDVGKHWESIRVLMNNCIFSKVVILIRV
jgi:hypothetical protein